MIYKLFSIKDKALDAYSAPFTQATIESGLRMWREMVTYSEADNRYRRSPEDYALYMIGDYDDSTATIISTIPTRIASANEVLLENKTPED